MYELGLLVVFILVAFFITRFNPVETLRLGGWLFLLMQPILLVLMLSTIFRVSVVDRRRSVPASSRHHQVLQRAAAMAFTRALASASPMAGPQVCRIQIPCLHDSAAWCRRLSVSPCG